MGTARKELAAKTGRGRLSAVLFLHIMSLLLPATKVGLHVVQVPFDRVSFHPDIMPVRWDIYAAPPSWHFVALNVPRRPVTSRNVKR